MSYTLPIQAEQLASSVKCVAFPLDLMMHTHTAISDTPIFTERLCHQTQSLTLLALPIMRRNKNSK